jgi:hypothetical protein
LGTVLTDHIATKRPGPKIIAAGTSIFLSAFLLFALEPLIAKRILPWFGGSAAVWSVCLVFYQVALLAGYLYARVLTRYLSQVRQAAVHIALLMAALLLLPIGPASRWRPGPQASPTWLILEMLTVTIGLPFAILAATSPLLQHWLARAGDEKPYRLFALSNFASLAALLLYPLAVEPNLDSRQQSLWWSTGFALFAATCAVFAWQVRKPCMALPEIPKEPIAITYKFYWIALSGCGSMLLLSITNQIDANVAAVPLLWVIPLAVYLLSFIVAFGSQSLYPRSLWLRLLAFALATVAYAIYDINSVLPIQISIPVYLGGLFIGCVFCQGELYRLRPAKSQITDFYLAIAAGGALGAIFVGLIAPEIFGGIYELPLTLALIAALALSLTWQNGGWGARVLWAGVTGCMAAVLVMNWQAYTQNSLALKRSFYGSLRVVQSPNPGPDQIRTLFHGTVQHGSEFLLPARQMQPTTYYAPDSGVGILLNDWQGPKRVGIVGLGAGTLAAYGRTGDTFRFYEINPQVMELARKYFFFLKNSGAQISMAQGDARLSLERELNRVELPAYDILVLDAFSGDAIPVHLLTKEAMSLYVRRVQPQGVVAFHVSNNFLDLSPVVRQLARSVGYPCLVVKNHANLEEDTLASEWVLVTRNTSILENDSLKLRLVPPSNRSDLQTWTDNFNSLLPILKVPEIHQ